MKILSERKKSKKSVIKIFFYILAIVYLTAFISWIFGRNIQLGILMQGEITVKFSSKAILIQDTYLIKNMNSENIHYLYNNGQRVRKNSEIIYIYPESEESLFTDYYILISELIELKRSMLTPDMIQSSDVINMEADRDGLMLKLYDTDADFIALDITSGLVKSANYAIISSRYEKIGENNDVLDLEEQIAQIQSELQKKNLVIKAPESGIFSAETDGYETSSSRDFISSLTESSINNIILNNIGKRFSENNIGKLITSEIYYFAVMIPENINNLIEDKEYIKIGFQEIPEPFNVLNHQIISLENNKYILILKTDKYLEKLIDKRVIDLDILISSKVGLKIPKTALVERNMETGLAQIFVSRNGYITKTEVKITAEDKQDVIIESDLIKTHDLLVKNPEKAREGMFIE